MRVILAICFIFFTLSTYAQVERERHKKDVILSAEIAGSFYSGVGMKVELIMPINENLSFLPKVGFGSSAILKMVPALIMGGSFVYGKTDHKIALSSNYFSLDNIGILSAEYRLISSGSGLSICTGVYMSFPEVYLFPGVSFGRAF